MRTSAASGPVFSLYLSIVLLVILVSVSDRTHARPREERGTGRRSSYYKEGCIMFGHACLGAQGKRFDSSIVRRNTVQESINQNIEEAEVPSPNDELFYVLPNDEFRERSDESFMKTHKDSSKQFDIYRLSSLVDQWIASHRRPHRIDTDIIRK